MKGWTTVHFRQKGLRRKAGRVGQSKGLRLDKRHAFARRCVLIPKVTGPSHGSPAVDISQIDIQVRRVRLAISAANTP